MSDSHTFSTVSEIASALAAKKISATELTQASIDRVRKTDAALGAFLHLDEANALAQARAADDRRSAGKTLGPLDGIPVGIKDVIAVEGQPLTCASRMLEKFVSPYDATVTTRLKNAGAVLFGRLNMDEFAMGSSTENSAFKPAANPWDTTRIPGGSSGGSAVAVASGQLPVSLGSDTGGSIRQPAALCGIVGMKPTYGLVSRFGLAAYASSLDQIGPFARTVEDTALLLQTIAGHDERDSTSCDVGVPDYKNALAQTDRKWRIGIPKEYFAEGLDAEVRSAVEQAIAFYRAQGCEICEVSLPHTEYAVAVYYIIATAEASSNLARYDGIRYTHRSERATDAIDIYAFSRAEGFGSEVKRRIMLGTYVLSSGYYDAYYGQAQKVRTLIRGDFLKAFENVDALLTPTSPSVAFRKGEKTSNPLEMYLADIYTISVNLAGLPGLSLPCGFSKSGLPIGLQLIGQPFKEAELFALAKKYEAAHEWSRRHPQI